jgi:type I pantothenate kinase
VRSHRYEDRLLAFRESVVKDPSSYFHHYASLSAEQTRKISTQIWRESTEKRRREHRPTRERADLISNHSVEYLEFRKI